MRAACIDVCMCARFGLDRSDLVWSGLCLDGLALAWLGVALSIFAHLLTYIRTYIL